MKSPKPNQKTNQTNTTTTTAAAASDLAKNPKITKVQQPTPTRQGKNGGQQKTRENQPTRAHQTKQQHDPSMDSTTPPPAHTQTNTKDAKHSAHKAGKQPTQQKYIGTLSSSQTTPAHPNQPEPHSPSRSSGAEEQVTHPVNKSQTQVQPPFTKRQPYQLHSFPLTGNNRSEATDGYITTNHQPTQTPRQMRIFRLGVRE